MKKGKIQKVIIKDWLLLKEPVLKRKEIREAFTIINPAYRWAKRRGNPWLPDKHLVYWEAHKKGLKVPRGAITKLKRIYKKHGIKIKLIDKTKLLPEIDLTFHGKLKKEKGQFAIKRVKNNFGLIKAPTGTGKTVLFIWIMAKLRQPTLICVHTNLLFKQWPKRLKTFLKLKDNEIGRIGGGVIDIKPVTVALMQNKETIIDHLDQFGLLGIDEAHRSSCETYDKIIRNYKGRYVYGLTATDKRTDGFTSPMKWVVGGVQCSISNDKANLCPCYYKFIPTDFKADKSFADTYSSAIVELARDQVRNKLIVKNIVKNIELPFTHVIVSQNRSHLTKLYKLLPKHIQMISEVITGKVKGKERDNIVDRMSKGKLKLVFATDKLIGEGFDEPLLSVIHLTTPIKSDVRLIQYVGRVRRELKGKDKSYVFDYFDPNEGILRNAARFRSKTYKKHNINKLEVLK